MIYNLAFFGQAHGVKTDLLQSIRHLSLALRLAGECCRRSVGWNALTETWSKDKGGDLHFLRLEPSKAVDASGTTTFG